MKQKHILKWLGIALGVYLLYGVLTAILVPLPQKEATGELWSQYEARLSEDASQERVRSIEDTDSALLWRLQLIESAEREVIFSTFDLRADGSGQDLMAALYGAAQRGVQVRVIVDGLNGFLHLQNSGVLRALAAEENVEVRFYDPIDLLRPWKLNYRLHDKYLIASESHRHPPCALLCFPFFFSPFFRPCCAARGVCSACSAARFFSSIALFLVSLTLM